MRGLGGANTLVLLNGQRLSNYAFNTQGGGTVNLNQIPFAAVERVPRGRTFHLGLRYAF